MRPLRRQIPDRNRAGRRGVGESGVASGSQGCRCVRRARGPVSPAEVCVRAVRAVPLGVAFLTLLLGRLSAQEALAFALGARVLTRFCVSVLTAVTPPGACRAASAVRTSPLEPRCSASVPLPGRRPARVSAHPLPCAGGAARPSAAWPPRAVAARSAPRFC